MIQFAIADLELYEDEAALFETYYNDYIPFWPEDKVDCFHRFIVRDFIELEEKNYGEEMVRVLELRSRVQRWPFW